MTGVIPDQIYTHLDQEKLLPEEQKGCIKGSRGTNDLLYIDRAVIKKVKSRNKNLAMAWIDYKKAFDMVPHSWIIESWDLFGVTENIKSLLVKRMEKWKVILCSGNSDLGEVEIKQDIFIPFSVCFSIDSTNFDFKKGQGSIWVFRKQRED